MATYQLNVNGQSHTVDAPAEMPLLWVLRDLLGLRGTKYGCGVGVCGSCVVHLDGQPIRSCQTKIEEVTGRDITTIEGLATNGLHPLQEAWLAEDVSQCGYCQPGILMTAAALLAGNADPTDEQIDQALADHVCRCGTYVRIRQAIHRAARRGGL